MTVVSFYFPMIEAEEKYVLGLMFHTFFLDIKWSYKLVRIGWFKVCYVVQNQTLNIWQGNTCV